jgi:hypothetical protein
MEHDRNLSSVILKGYRVKLRATAGDSTVATPAEGTGSGGSGGPAGKPRATPGKQRCGQFHLENVVRGLASILSIA